MTKNRKSLETAAYLATVTLLSLPIISPLIRWSSTACTHDGHLHYHRVAALGHSWASGLLFSRWMPDLVFGYGYPFFNFREAVPLYLTLWLQGLGMSLPAALNLFYIVCIVAAGWFMFLWIRDLFGPVSGIVSAVAYMAAPYLLIDTLVRGNQPESIALALFPLLCWTGRRFMIGRRPLPFAISVLAYVLLALSHNISLLLFTPFLLLYLAFVGWIAGHPARKILLGLGLIFGLGLAISAFYVGPALLEMDQITISQSVSARNNDFRFNFASLSEILILVTPADPQLLNPPLLIKIGWITAALALIGIVAGLFSKVKEKRAHAIFMASAAAIFLFMSLSISSFIWEFLPLIEFVQFPWRFIGRAALPLAFLAGIPFSVLPELIKSKKVSNWAAPLLGAAAVVLLVIEATPYLYPHQCRNESDPDINMVHAYEHSSGLVGVDPLGSYFPKTVLERPKGSPLEDDYLVGEQPQRFDETSLPESAALIDVEYGPLSFSGRIDSPTTFQARYFTFDFPGWTAEVDGQMVPITPSNPEGLITFPIPAGSHEVEVSWGMTPLRLILTILSTAALIGLIGVTIVFYRQGKSSADAGVEQALAADIFEESAAADERQWLRTIAAFLLAVLLLIIIKFLFVDAEGTPLYRTDGPSVTFPTQLAAEGLRAAGYNLDKSAVEAGQSFQVDLALIVDQTPARVLQTNLWLKGSDGHLWSLKETFRPRTFQEPSPTTFWLPGQWAWDSREIEVLQGTPPGSYELILTLFDRSSLQPVTLSDSNGEEIGPEMVIGRIEVAPSDKFNEETPQYKANIPLSGLNLLGYNLDRDRSVPGDHFLLTLFWSSDDKENDADNQLSLQLVDSAGEAAGSWIIPPVGELYPPSDWEEDVILRGQHSLGLDAHLESGDYLLVLEDYPLGRMSIEAPDRLFTPPPYKTAAGANFDVLIELVGISFDLEDPDPDTGLTVELIWQVLAEMPDRYHVFVHLTDETGQILEQSDGEPAGWTRPTTGWLPGEFIVDTHTLKLPDSPHPSELALRIGIYDPIDGTRLKTGKDDFIIIPLVQDQ